MSVTSQTWTTPVAHDLCRKKLHAYTPENTIHTIARGKPARCCRACKNAWRRKKRRGITPTSVGFATTAQRLSAQLKSAWKRKGANFHTPEGRASRAMKRKALAATRRWCRKGLHPWIESNIVRGKRRNPTCRRCSQESWRRYAQARKDRTAQVDQRTALWQARIDAHPDKGGTVARFIAADRAWRRFSDRRAKAAAVAEAQAS